MLWVHHIRVKVPHESSCFLVHILLMRCHAFWTVTRVASELVRFDAFWLLMRFQAMLVLVVIRFDPNEIFLRDFMLLSCIRF
jgi:hypothetical protein